jgi:hypothetical protein
MPSPLDQGFDFAERIRKNAPPRTDHIDDIFGPSLYFSEMKVVNYNTPSPGGSLNKRNFAETTKNLAD